MKNRDKYYLKNYGITEADYQKMFKEQAGVCKICHKPPGKVRLAVDHFHRVKIKIEPNPFFQGNETKEVRNMVKYHGEAEVRPDEFFICFGPTKKETLSVLKNMYRRSTVRGLLCSSCNRALGKIEDPRWQWGPEELKQAAKYLEDFNGKAHQT